LRPAECRHRITSQLLQASEPLDLAALAEASHLSIAEARAALEDLVREGLVIVGQLMPGRSAPVFRWAARWREEADLRSRVPKEQFSERMALLEQRYGANFDICDEAAQAFHSYVIDEYAPPQDKRWLVFAQCSVRRPFSSSPSHASIRRAIDTATGFDPAADMARCPVHVVVLASRVGPAPYDLQDEYPACVRSGGVKDFGGEMYARYRPVLIDRMVDYLRAHGECYEHVAGFGDGRYGDILRATGERVDNPFPVFPAASSPRLVKIGKSRPRKYWEKYWIQLYMAILEWLDEVDRIQADERLAALDVSIERGSR